jgi:diguanylate cyclase (GGDEF)-like protein
MDDNQDLCVALIDLDHFGVINKEHGWPTGDQVLRRVATTIMQSIRGSDWVARYGGEEICIVMPGTRLESALIVSERIRSSIETMKIESTSGAAINVTLSIGVVALNPATDPTARSLVERVSQRTLAAKATGRNRVVG